MARVLVVDDEALVRFSLRGELEDAGHEVVEAVDGQDAIDKAWEGKSFDLVITDMLMPRKEGFETIAHFRIHYPGTKVIAISGWLKDDDITKLGLEAAREDGVDGYLTKPFTGPEMIDEVAKVLGAGSV